MATVMAMVMEMPKADLFLPSLREERGDGAI